MILKTSSTNGKLGSLGFDAHIGIEKRLGGCSVEDRVGGGELAMVEFIQPRVMAEWFIVIDNVCHSRKIDSVFFFES